MATFTASAADAGAVPFYAPNGDITRVVRYTLGAAMSAGDVFRMVKVPPGAIVSRVQGAIWSHDGVVTVTVGDGNDFSAFAAATVLSGTATVAGTRAIGLGRSYSVEDTIDIMCTAVSAASANGVLILGVTYSNQN